MTLTASQNFKTGLIHGLPFMLVLIPFGGLVGVVSMEAGLDLLQVMVMTIWVLAGAAQLTALQMLNDGAAVGIVVLAGLVVNLRFLLYSANLALHVGDAPWWQRLALAYGLVDQLAVASSLYNEEHPNLPTAHKLAYAAGVIVPIWFSWVGGTFAGAQLGALVSDEMALDFAIPITFLALIGPALKSIPHVVAAFVSVVIALSFAHLPYNAGLLIAALCAMFAGAITEYWLERRHD